MQTARRWLVWRGIPQRGRKPRKVPYYADGTARQATDTNEDAARLVDFETAIAAMAHGRYFGLGFALGPDGTGDCWQGTDLDGTDSRPELAALADLLPGYVERSPSGKGVHAIGKGPAFPPLGSNQTGIEAYSGGRFFTVTGDAVGGDIEDLSPFVAEVLAPKHGKRKEQTAPDLEAYVSPQTVAELRGALNAIPSDAYDVWVRMGCALSELGDTGRELWLTWSQTSEKWRPQDARKWATFRADHTGHQSVFAEAQRCGWVNPMSAAAQAAQQAPETEPDKLTALDAEELVAWSWRTGTKLPKTDAWPRVRVTGNYTAPWPSVAARAQMQGRFPGAVDDYLPRRAELVARENLKRMEAGQAPQPDIGDDELRRHAVHWAERVAGLDVPDERARELLAMIPAPGSVPGAPGAARPPFRLVHVSTLLEQPEPLRWLVRDYLMPESLAMLYGDSTAGKSLLAIDWAGCVATGRPYGTALVAQAPAVYVAGEGHHGIRRRLLAWGIHHACVDELREAPLFVSETGAAFTDPGSVATVIEAVDAIASEHGAPGLVVVDTLHRNLGGGDENSAQDIGAFIKAADTLRSRYHCALLIVHHTGHASKDRARGSSSLRAAVDAEFCLEAAPGGERTLSVTKMKDAPTPEPLGFELAEITLPWLTEDGTPETSVVLEATGAPTRERRKPVSGAVRLAFDTLLAATQERGFAPPAHWGGPAPRPIRVVSLEPWREQFYARHTGDTGDTKRRAFNRARGDLVDAGSVRVWSDSYWATPEHGPWPSLVGAWQAAGIMGGTAHPCQHCGGEGCGWCGGQEVAA